MSCNPKFPSVGVPLSPDIGLSLRGLIRPSGPQTGSGGIPSTVRGPVRLSPELYVIGKELGSLERRGSLHSPVGTHSYETTLLATYHRNR